MVTPQLYSNRFVEIKYMLSSYRALCDGRSGISEMKNLSRSPTLPIFTWKILWIGTCAILRASIDTLRKVDCKSCLPEPIRIEFQKEWDQILNNKEDHSIFWDFLQKERNEILHQYEWSAYELWLKPDGTSGKPPTILGGNLHDVSAFFLMRKGKFKGRDSIELLEESASWVENRIFDSIKRAGFNPNEKRSVHDFRIMTDEDVVRVAPATALLFGLTNFKDEKMSE